MTRLTSCPEAEAAAARAAAVVRREIDRARDERGAAHIALSGGTTPRRTYELLAADGGDWSEVHIWFADERCVPPDDPESNYLLVEDTLLKPARIPGTHEHRMWGELGPVHGARQYAAELMGSAPTGDGGDVADDADGRLPVLDLVVLGIGPDGHVASLFPRAGTLDAPPGEVCLPVSDAPKPPPQRITLSLSVLRAARCCLLLATGSSKSDAVSAMLGEPTPSVPASLLRRDRLAVIVDDAASPPAPRT